MCICQIYLLVTIAVDRSRGGGGHVRVCFNKIKSERSTYYYSMYMRADKRKKNKEKGKKINKRERARAHTRNTYTYTSARLYV